MIHLDSPDVKDAKGTKLEARYRCYALKYAMLYLHINQYICIYICTQIHSLQGSRLENFVKSHLCAPPAISRNSHIFFHFLFDLSLRNQTHHIRILMENPGKILDVLDLRQE